MRPVKLQSSADYLKQSGLASKRRAGRFNIEGDLVTLTDIAARLGISDTRAGTRLQREQKLAGPVTWAGLSR